MSATWFYIMKCMLQIFTVTKEGFFQMQWIQIQQIVWRSCLGMSCPSTIFFFTILSNCVISLETIYCIVLLFQRRKPSTNKSTPEDVMKPNLMQACKSISSWIMTISLGWTTFSSVIKFKKSSCQIWRIFWN